jgi:hypothetical protein
MQILLHDRVQVYGDPVSVGRDHIVLSARELQALAAMGSEVARPDPSLDARMMAGRPRRFPARRFAWRPAWRPRPYHAVILLVAGAVEATAPMGSRGGWP